MAVDHNENCMWNKNDDLTLHKMRDFVIKNMTEQPLNVMIPRRNIKVPHIKSKKVQQLQARPRDPNASPHLLMIAPPNDFRYRTLHASQSLPNGYNASNKKQYHNQSQQPTTSTHYQSTPSLNQSTRTPQNGVDPTRGWFNSGQTILPQQMPGSDYFQQISTIAAMAWSDCSQATEKLRRIYEQTSFLGRDSLSVLNPYAPQYTSNQFLPNDVIDHARRTQEITSQRRKVKSNLDTERYNFDISQSAYCACAVCEMAKRTKSTMMTSQTNSQHNPNKRQIQATGHVSRAPTNHITTRSKRTRSPEISYQNQPPKKLVKQEAYSLVNAQLQRHQAAKFMPATEDSLSSYLTAGCLPLKTNENLNYFNPNLLLPASLQLPTSSNNMTSSNEFSMTSSNPHDLVMTPSFENSQFFNAHMNASNPLGGAIFNGFSNFLPPQILNALE